MNGVFGLIISLCVFSVISVIVRNLTSGSKLENYVRPVITCVCLTVILNFFIKFDFNDLTSFDIDKTVVDSNAVWDNTLSILSEKTEEQMMILCKKNGISINSIEVEIKTDYKDFEIKAVNINGKDAAAAKNLIAGYFQVGLAYINITED